MKKIIIIPASIITLLTVGYLYVVLLLPLELPKMHSSTVFIDIKGQELGEGIYSGSVRHEDIISEKIPDFYKKSLVTLEDRTFWTNNGISIRGIIRSIIHNVEAGKTVEGGTTLSSGLIRNIFWIGENRTTTKKILEFLYAIRLNHLYTKDQILTEYINRVNYGYMNYGLKSAAKYYFRKSPENLTEAEQIALLILPKDSKKYDPYKKPKNFRTRFEIVTEILTKEGILSTEEQKDILKENFSWNTEHTAPLPYVTDFLKTRKDLSQEGKIQTTFNRELTEQIDTIAQSTLSEIAWKNVSDYGILVVERMNNTQGIENKKSAEKGGNLSENRGPKGDVRNGTANEEPEIGGQSSHFSEISPLLRVMIGGANYRESSAGQVNTTLALRQPGSTIKPFTYTLAFEKLGFTPETTILDLPVAYKTSEDYAYEPKNYSQSYKGEITLRQALSESVNVPAIKLAEQVGVPTLLSFLRGLGITSLTDNADHYGLGLTLGNGEVSLFELLQAYTIFTNDGNYCPFKILETTEATGKCVPRIDKKYIDMITSILTDRYAKIGDFPLYSALDFENRKVAVKTGTSRNFRDNWAVGYTEHYMIGVWTGNKDGENMKGVTGATGAGEIFRRIVYLLEKNEQTPDLIKKDGIRKEYLTITNPLQGSLYKATGINPEKEKIGLRFETNISYDSQYWLLDGKRISENFITPIPGNHTIEVILMKDGEIIQKEANSYKVETK